MFYKEWGLFCDIMSFIMSKGMCLLYFMIFLVLLYISAKEKILGKSAYPTWIAWIPFASIFFFYRMMWKGTAFWTVVFSAIAFNFVAILGGGIFLIFRILIAIFMLGVHAVYSYNFSKAFGHNIIFAVISFLFPYFAILYAGFSEAKYTDRWYRT